MWDLADHSEEARMSISVARVIELTNMTGLSMQQILGVEAPEVFSPIPTVEFPTLARAALDKAGCTTGEFAERIGWSLAEAIESPHRLLDLFNWDGLVEVAGALGKSAWSFVPPDAIQGEQAMAHQPA
jgi:hypothetical protein